MSDADYLISIGLGAWVKGEGLPLGREIVESRKEKLMLRGRDRKQVFRNDEALELSNELIEVKEKLKILEKREKELKKSLMEKMELGEYIRLYPDGSENNYIVEYIKKTSQPVINKKAALNFIKRKYGNTAAISFEENCTSVRKGSGVIYVRPFPKSVSEKEDTLSSNGQEIRFDDTDDDCPL